MLQVAAAYLRADTLGGWWQPYVGDASSLCAYKQAYDDGTQLVGKQGTTKDLHPNFKISGRQSNISGSAST